MEQRDLKGVNVSFTPLGQYQPNRVLINKTMDDIELEDFGERREREEQREREQQEQETNVDDESRDDLDDDNVIIGDDNNDIIRFEDEGSRQEWGENSSIRGLSERGREFEVDQKIILLGKLEGIRVNERAGPNSVKLFDELELTTRERSGIINGAKFRGKKIIVTQRGIVKYSTDRSLTLYVNEFKDLLRKANYEYEGSIAPIIDESVGEHVSEDVVDDVRYNVVETLDDMMRREEESIGYDGGEDDLRLLEGILSSNYTRIL